MTGPVLWGVGGYARRLLHLLTPDMAVLWDKGFDGNDFLAAVTATGAPSSWGGCAATGAPPSSSVSPTGRTCRRSARSGYGSSMRGSL